MVVFVILSGLLAFATLAAAVAAVWQATRKGRSGPRATAPRPLPDSAKVRGTMQPLHAEAFSDVIVLDGYVMLEEADQISTLTQGLATLALSTPPSASVRADSAHRRLQEWIDAGTVLDVEVRHHGFRVELDVRDHTSTMQFDVASAL